MGGRNHAGFLYEPRVLWDVPSSPLPTSTRVRLERDHFRNGEPYDYILTHILIAPVGIPHRSGSDVSYGANAGALYDVGVRVRFPERYGRSRLTLGSYGFVGKPTAGWYPNAARPWASSGLVNIMAWHFKRSTPLLPLASPEIGFTHWARSAASTADIADVRPELSMCLYQKHPWMGSRMGTTRREGTRNAMLFNFGSLKSPFPQPVGPDAGAYDIAADAELVGSESIVFGQQEMAASSGTARNLGRQDQQQLAAHITGFGITIDQMAIDDNANTAGGGPRVYMPLQNMAGIQVRPPRSAPGGGRYWWRDYPVISLVCPTINDVAIVHELPTTDQADGGRLRRSRTGDRQQQRRGGHFRHALQHRRFHVRLR